MLLNQSAFARAIGVSRQAITKAVSGKSVVLSEGKVDTDNKINKKYILSTPDKRIAFEKFVSGDSSSKKTKKRNNSVAKSTKKMTPGNKKPVSTIGIVDNDSAEFEDNEELTSKDMLEKYSDIKAKADAIQSQEKAVKLRMANQKERNNLADRNILGNIIEVLISSLFTAIPRTNATLVTDLAKMILSDGECKNSHYKFAEDALMDMAFELKNKIEKLLEDNNI